MAAISPDSPFWSGVPTISGHARKRWRERTDESVAIETAWAESQRLDPRHCGESTSELRVHEPTETVLVREDKVIVTAMATRPPEAEAWLISAVYEAVGNIWGTPGAHTPEVDDAE